ncbi:hypothetical protein C2G38_2153777 [Gigaspora rosea]|uniref:Protein kinase domain-containing protein n=1 Tax=Gigaspora rosea TaxID=44941 RepID=A0A397W5L9_9GLOM|nr:hypothetical protein C2G38_2153777 [Gigaspora rosea]
MVMEYAKQKSLRKLLDTSVTNSNSKGLFGILPYIAPEVLYKKLSRQKMRPITSEQGERLAWELGVVKYVECSNRKEYTQKSGIYSFGIIMSEVFTGYPLYHDIPHNGDLDQVKST